MKVVNLKGGLGNQFFQYAFGKSLEKETGATVKYDTTWFENVTGYDHGILYLDFFETEYEVADKKEIESMYPLDRLGKNIAERLSRITPFVSQLLFGYFKEIGLHENVILKSKPYQFKYSPKVYSTGKNSYFDGYWQTTQYVDKVSDILIKEFRLTDSLSEQSEVVNKEINKSESVSIHIRRGDYTKNNHTLPVDYYKKSVEEIESRIEDPQYYIFSDDINWVRNNLKINGNCTYIDHNGAETAYEDLILMSSCNHNIIANSTFSWWGAWLNQHRSAIVLAPEIWLGWGNTDDMDILPNAWETVPIGESR